MTAIYHMALQADHSATVKKMLHQQLPGYGCSGLSPQTSQQLNGWNGSNISWSNYGKIFDFTPKAYTGHLHKLWSRKLLSGGWIAEQKSITDKHPALVVSTVGVADFVDTCKERFELNKNRTPERLRFFIRGNRRKRKQCSSSGFTNWFGGTLWIWSGN